MSPSISLDIRKAVANTVIDRPQSRQVGCSRLHQLGPHDGPVNSARSAIGAQHGKYHITRKRLYDGLHGHFSSSVTAVSGKERKRDRLPPSACYRRRDGPRVWPPRWRDGGDPQLDRADESKPEEPPDILFSP